VGDYTPVYRNGADPFTSTASAAITGGQVLEATTTGAVGPAGALSLKFVGVAAHDAASGARLTIWPIPGLIHETVNGNAGTITVGNPIVPGATGNVDTATAATAAAAGYLMGTAVTTAVTTAKVRWIGR
jgi:Uncharacterized conserved protein (DUF2190)